GRTRQDDATYLLCHEGRNGHGDGEISLAGSSRANAKDHVAFFDGFHIAALVDALGLQLALAKRTLLSGFSESLKGGAWVGRNDAKHAIEIAVYELVAAFPQVFVIGEDLLGAVHVGRRSFDLDGVCAKIDLNLQAVFEQAQVFVAGPEKSFDIRADIDIFLQRSDGHLMRANAQEC